MITLKFPIQLDLEDRQFIKELQQVQSSMIRSAYKQSSFGLAEISIRTELRERFDGKLDSWFLQSAVKSGIGMFKSDHETGRTSRIFGSKNNFIRRCKLLISKEEWKELRLLPLYLIGEGPQKGNRKFDFFQDHIIFKPWKGKKIEIKLPSMRNNWKKLWHQAVMLSEEKKLPITVSLTATYIFLSFDDQKCKEEICQKRKVVKNRYAGIDLNPNYIGVSVFDGERLVDTKLYSFKDLPGKNTSASKLEHETREVAYDLGRWLQHLQVDKVFIEQLSFKQGDRGLGKNLNRLCQNQWKKSTFKSALSKYFKLYEVNAAYSSTIGNVMNRSLPDPIAASTEIARRGYHIVIMKSKKFYPELPTMTYLRNLWKEIEIPVVETWKELHDFIKKSKLKYRVPVPEARSFRRLRSRRSQVYVLDNLCYT